MTTFISTQLRNGFSAVGLILLALMFSQNLHAQGCSQPSNLNSNVISTNSVELSWSAISGARNYTVQYRIGESGRWTTAPRTMTTSLVLTGLQPNTVYSWRVKASCSTYSSFAKFNTGGGVGGNVSCSQPSNLTSSGLSTTSVQLSWSAIEGALNYTVQYRPGSTGAWLNGGTTNGTSLTLTGLQPNTLYTWRVTASCSDYSSVTEFTTGSTNGGGGGGGGGSTSCSAPSNTNTDAVFPTSANVSWEAQFDATNYIVQYRLETATSYITAGTTTNTQTTITGLQPGREYVWRVKASCSPYGSDVQFSTPRSSTSGAASLANNDFVVAPNPVSGEVATLQLQAIGAQIMVMDYLGKVVIREINTDVQHQLNVAQLPNGVYAISILYADHQLANAKLVVAK
ncbi:MAG: T9SS type A sorting domain-containing protein [Saprospiraceae bacterium]|nr:T9SS type A sorting domain-containing protein [Saprospiraceae bacterium]